MADELNALVALAEERSKHYDLHGVRMWVWHGWLVGWTLLANVLIPFGLAALLYVPESYRNAATLVLLAISGISLGLQLLTTVQRFKERAKHLWALRDEMRATLANYKAGLKTEPEFSASIESIMKKHLDEPAPG